ncbi:MAG: hypothetical protein ABJN36_11620 [Cyclobacteriaceae bacterium]
MNLKDFELNFAKVKKTHPDFHFVLNKGTDEPTIASFSNDLGVEIPENVSEFFQHFNGLTTQNPDLEILRIERWEMIDNGKLKFATINGINICFDCSRTNQAGQWTILNAETNYELTLTMSSFWSNKIWHWIRTGKEIWKDEFWLPKN